MSIQIERLNQESFRINASREDCIELLRMFFRYDIRSIYNAPVISISKVLKQVLDCKYLQDNEKALLLQFVLDESLLKENQVLNVRYLGKKRLGEIKRLNKLYSEIYIVQIY